MMYPRRMSIHRFAVALAPLCLALACAESSTATKEPQPVVDPQPVANAPDPVGATTATAPPPHGGHSGGGGADRDGDGIPDASDKCPGDPEDFDGFEDEDGCPDPDNDRDGVLDVDDVCPVKPGTAQTKGCPDQDGDGLLDTDDECPADAGPEASFGCPDKDGDLVPDARDKCPDQKGPADANPAVSDGCPATSYIAEGKIVITEKVQFDTGKAVIKKESFGLLDNVAKLLEDNKGIKRIQVEGHTDDQGDDNKNLKLSQDRADAVKAYLIGKGIAAERLVAMGFGETKPVGDNKTPAGQEMNRRVEFMILEQDEPKE